MAGRVASKKVSPAQVASAPESELGARLRALRTSYGLSQRELARRAGVPNGTVSMIELGQVSPSIASMKKVAAGLSLTLAEFFSIDLDGGPDVFFAAADLPDVGGRDIAVRLVGKPGTARQLQVMHERYAPGSDTGRDMLSHIGEEAGVVVRGRIEITVGARVHELGPGDGYHFASRVPHRFRNRGREVFEIVSACTPPPSSSSTPRLRGHHMGAT